MSTKVQADKALTDSKGIGKVWSANPDLTLGKSDDIVTLQTYQGAVKKVDDLSLKVEDTRHTLKGLLDERDDAARVLTTYNSRALSAFRGIFGPDSVEYDQAGGVRSSERKVATRKAIVKAA